MRVLIHLSLLVAIIVLSGCVKPLPPPAAPPAEPRDKDGYTVHERDICNAGAHWQRADDLHVLRAYRNRLQQREGHSARVLTLSDAITNLEAAK